MAEKVCLSQTKQALLNLLANNLFGAGSAVVDENVDWRTLWLESYLQTVSLLVFSNYTPSRCTQEDLSKIRSKLNNTLTQSLAVQKEHAKLHRILTSAGIEYVILKGYAAAHYYKDPLLRSMGDVDFLVREKDVEKAEEILLLNGYVSAEKSHGYHRVYLGECRLEMHTEPAGIPQSPMGQTVRGLLRDIIDSRVLVNTMFGEMYLPSQFHHGLVLLLHTAHHLTNEGLGLRHLCDWAVFAGSFGNSDFENIFSQKLKSVGLWDFAKILTKTSVIYLGCPQKEWAQDADVKLCDTLILDIIKSGNLGQKNVDRSHEGLLVSADGKNKGIGYIIKYFNNIVYSNWKFTKKWKIFLPFGWVYFTLRYIFRSVKGERPEIRPKNIITEANSRNAFFNELKLFRVGQAYPNQP